MSSVTHTIEHGVYSHIGRMQNNQDAVFVTSEPEILNGKGRLFAVADGMGGHPGGGLASRMACDGLKQYHEKINEKGKRKPKDISRHLVETIMRIDRGIRLKGLRDGKLEDGVQLFLVWSLPAPTVSSPMWATAGYTVFEKTI